MVTYKFKLIDSKVPEIRGKCVITDSNVGGVKNVYRIWLIFIFVIPIIHISIEIPLKYLGKKGFLRPYKTYWDKVNQKLPPVYWGKAKHPLLNMWLILSNNYRVWDNTKVLLVEQDTRSRTVSIYNSKFLSHDLIKNLKRNQTFYQSKII